MAHSSGTGQDSQGGSRGYIVVILNVTLLVLSSAIVLSRFYVRAFLIKGLGWDDGLVAAAFLFVAAVSCLEIVLVGYGAGSHINTLSRDQLNTFFSLLPVGQLVFFPAGGFMRLSILAFLPCLSKDDGYRRVIWATGAVIVITTLVPFFYFIFGCSSISGLYNRKNPDLECLASINRTRMILASSIFGIFLDLVLFGLPVYKVYCTMVFSPKATKVMLIFGIGFLAIVMGIVRTCMFLTTDFKDDPTFKVLDVCTWSILELHLGLWCGSFPALQPLLRLISSKLDFCRRLGITSEKQEAGSTATSQAGMLFMHSSDNMTATSKTTTQSEV